MPAEDAVAYRTRARCEKAPDPKVRTICPATQSLKTQRASVSRKRLRRTVASSSHEDLNNNAPEEKDAAIGEGSVASNPHRVHEDDGQRKTSTPRRRGRVRRVVSSPSSSSSTSGDSDVVIVGEFQSKDRNDVVVTEPPAKRPCTASKDVALKEEGPANQNPGDEDLDDDEDLRIVGMVGQVVTRDLPHPRPDCAEHRFRRGEAASEAHSKCCEQCYCYVCDVKAAECRFWGSGRRERDHANARSHPAWNVLRTAARAGNTDLVKREFETSGPLRMLPPPCAASASAPLLRLTEATAQPSSAARRLEEFAALLRRSGALPPLRRQQQPAVAASARGGGFGTAAAFSSRGRAEDGGAGGDVDSHDAERFLAAMALMRSREPSPHAAVAAGSQESPPAWPPPLPAPQQHQQPPPWQPPVPASTLPSWDPRTAQDLPYQRPQPLAGAVGQPLSVFAGGALPQSAPLQQQQQQQQQSCIQHTPLQPAQLPVQIQIQGQTVYQHPSTTTHRQHSQPWTYPHPHPQPQPQLPQRYSHVQQPHDMTQFVQQQQQPYQRHVVPSYPQPTGAVAAPGPGPGPSGYHQTAGGGGGIAWAQAQGHRRAAAAAPPPPALGAGFPQPYLEAAAWTYGGSLGLYSIPWK